MAERADLMDIIDDISSAHGDLEEVVDKAVEEAREWVDDIEQSLKSAMTKIEAIKTEGLCEIDTFEEGLKELNQIIDDLY